MATPSFSWSPLDLGSIATWMTGAGKSMDSRITGCLSSHSVSPVVVCFRPMTPTMSPAPTASISSRHVPNRGRGVGVLAGHTDGERAVGVDQPDQFALHLAGQHHPDHVHRAGRG